MTSHEWEAKDNFWALLIALRGNEAKTVGLPTVPTVFTASGDLVVGPAEHTSPNRLRAFAAACLPRWRELPLDSRSSEVIDAYEAFTTGSGTYDAFWEKCGSLVSVPATEPQPWLTQFLSTQWDDTPFGVYQMTENLLSLYAYHVARDEIVELERNATPDERDDWVWNGWYGESPLWREAVTTLQKEFVCLLRETVGNPFRPVTFSPSWRTDTAMSLARTMYDSRDFSAMPILADALQDAGCDNEDILNHCRDPKQIHVRGCWVVDLVLGKE